MKIVLNEEITKDYVQASSREWLETNGLGGWASSTLAGANSRSYHGMFVVATNPPVGRVVLISKLEEFVMFRDRKYELSSNQFPGKICATGLEYFERFEHETNPVFHYNIENTIEISKSVIAIYEEDKVIVTYEVKKAPGEFEIEIKPFLAYRDYHSLQRQNDRINQEALFGNGLLRLSPYPEYPSVFVYIRNSQFRFSPEWFLNFEYKEELNRGLQFQEDLFSHGNFIVRVKQGSKVAVVMSTKDPSREDPFKLVSAEQKRRERLSRNMTFQDDLIKRLTIAADQFVVRRGKNLKTIIAGYHWFSDWGRDTMISLPGICLVTGRFEEAKKILKAFAKSIDMGMIPNRFPDEGEEPEYNTVDATLWFFVAIKRYLDYTNDRNFVLKDLLPVLKDIISWHDRGTRYNIKVDQDGLLYAGQPGVQLTWMDAKIGDWVVTPREGKAVEINALWYNALMILGELTEKKAEFKLSKQYYDRAESVKNAFLNTFVIHDRGYLFDYINHSEKSDAIRPNQLFAISLPYSLLDHDLSQSILRIVEEKLLTPVGLRSLSPDDPMFRGTYHGDQLARDGAYHQGTVWSWLIGPYITAKIKLQGDEGRAEVLRWIESFTTHLSEAGIGTISEIFEGNHPFYPKGCIAQAWSVAELLRAYVEDVLGAAKTGERRRKS
ncbi:MAG: amylo-alpha-1,6-glucosidase [Cytophagaceae bacterium]